MPIDLVGDGYEINIANNVNEATLPFTHFSVL
jgi:hypothetical protein